MVHHNVLRKQHRDFTTVHLCKENYIQLDNLLRRHPLALQFYHGNASDIKSKKVEKEESGALWCKHKFISMKTSVKTSSNTKEALLVQHKIYEQI
jgi:hypothetical protein